MIKPEKLHKGDKVAAVTLSWGGPGTIPERYEAGKRQLENEFKISVVETPHAMKDPAWIANNPQARADDLMEAFLDNSIKGIISTIGGDDSIRLIKHIDLAVIRNNPKVFVGYSDTTVTHLACLKAGLVSFYGPAVMAGFAENCGMHRYLVESFRKMVFSSDKPGCIPQNSDGWTVEMLDWSVAANQSKQREMNLCKGWNFIQGAGISQGHLIGGCLEILEWLKGTELWPSIDKWNDAILFLETSEEAPPPEEIKRAMRVYAAQGILNRLSGILFGRPGGQINPESFKDYDNAILEVVSGEEGLVNLPIITQMDFGHTDPIMTLPYGVKSEIDCDNKTFSIIENSVND